MFAALVFERDPLKLADVEPGLLLWVQVVGGFALFGALCWMAISLPAWRGRDHAAVPLWQRFLFIAAVGVSAITFLAGGLVTLIARESAPPTQTPQPQAFLANILFTVGGLFGLLAVSIPFLAGLIHAVYLARFRPGRLIRLASPSFRRILALAGLSFKEAIRRRVLYVFSVLIIVFLFGSWFIPSKPEDQLRTYVGVVFFVMSFLLLIASAIISSFSIPADIKQQTIHTVVTKPVERFEIVLGRFLGFYALMTLALIAMTALSLIYILRGINPDAAAESLKARNPLYGELIFENTPSSSRGVNVGHEWDYRGYITRGKDQAARWDVSNIPAFLGNRPDVLTEYAFKVFRTTKGEEGKNVVCKFAFRTWRCRRGIDDRAYLLERKEGNDKLNDELAEKYGYFEKSGLLVDDHRTLSFRVPGGLFRNAAGDPEGLAKLRARGQVPELRVHVTCETPAQYVGMAQYDTYFRLDTSDASAWLFAVNFFKAAFGLWLQIGLVIALAVVLSTYLNGVITLMLTLMLFLGGFFQDFIRSVAFNKNASGGPLESLRAIANRGYSTSRTAASDTAGDRFVNASDDGFRFVVARILNVLPDVERYDTTRYLGEGFDIPWVQLLLSLLMLLGYLVPWFVLAYYLLQWREIASST